MAVTPILVPIDGSDFSEQALHLACDIARRTSSALHIVQVHTITHPIAYPEIVPPYEPDWETALRIHQREHLVKLRNELDAIDGLEVNVALLQGPIVDQLVQYVEAHGIGRVVMTTHGRGGLSRAWLGSVASELVRFVGIPVVLIRPGNVSAPLTEAESLRHIVVPLDGSALSESILPEVLALARLADAQITLLHVTEAAGVHSAQYLEHVASTLRADDVRVDVAVVANWKTAAAIIDFAAHHGADMIAMATHGRGAWSRWVVGSVADKVLRGCSLPMLTLRPIETSAASDAEAGAATSKELLA